MSATAERAAQATDVILRDGSTLRLRAPAAEDADALLEFFSGLSEHSLYLRFHGFPVLRPKLVEPVLEPDWQERGALLGSLDGRVVAVANWVRLRDPRAAEIAFAVDDEFQRRGIGTRLLERLAATAGEAGVEEFVAEVLHENDKMLRVFRKAGFAVTRAGEGGELEIRLAITPTDAYREQVAERDHVSVRASLEPFFQPRSVAVIGASKRRGSIGGELFRNIVTGDFAGSAYPVNRKGDSVAGVHGYGAVAEIGDGVDLAVICVPGELVLDAAEEALAAGVRALVVISAGFAETGTEGTERQERLLELVRAHGARLLGPNCLGIASTAVHLNATFAPRSFPAGKIGFSSQSGALGLALLERAEASGLGVTSFVSIGNKADVSSNDLLEWWEDDEATELVVLYLESFGNPRAFARIARRLARRKPILALKGGTTRAGIRAAGSHTAALAGSDAAADALFADAGVIRARTLDELIDVASLLSAQPVPRGRRVAVVTNAGGLGILAADACEALGLELPPPSEETRAALATVMPAEGSAGESDRPARRRERGELRAGAAAGARRSVVRRSDRALRPDRRHRRGGGRSRDQPRGRDGGGQARPLRVPQREGRSRRAAERRAGAVLRLSRGRREGAGAGGRARRVAPAAGGLGARARVRPRRGRGRRARGARGRRRLARSRADAPPARGVRRSARARARRGHQGGGGRGGARARLPGRAQDRGSRRAQDRAGRHRPRPRRRGGGSRCR